MVALGQLSVTRRAASIEDLCEEIARLALLCGIRTLDPGTITRVIKRDGSVCGTHNPVAFVKLHGVLTMYFALRKRLGEALGQDRASALEALVLEHLRATFPGLSVPWPPRAG